MPAGGGAQPRGLMSVWSFFAGDRTPIGQGRTLLKDLVASQPADVDSLVLLGGAMFRAIWSLLPANNSICGHRRISTP